MKKKILNLDAIVPEGGEVIVNGQTHRIVPLTVEDSIRFQRERNKLAQEFKDSPDEFGAAITILTIKYSLPTLEHPEKLPISVLRPLVDFINEVTGVDSDVDSPKVAPRPEEVMGK